ncbi:MAG: transglycosylase domain-containing protein [Treponema sp.]|jgi:penicillin-binding protein 1C|nr:transglycosylase domain-containing protein [Treponema sp.]
MIGHRQLKIIISLFGIAAVLWAFFRFLPYPELEAYRSRSYGLALYDRSGNILRVFPADDGVKREWTFLGDIPAGARRVFIRAEDARFYFHPGIDPAALAASALRNLRAGRIVSGASTITMQLARLVKPHGPGLKGKIGEAFDALRLEARLSKKRILELWFNGIPFGSNIEGIAAMTRARFGRNISELDDSRAALLAVIPRRPGLYDPALNPETAISAALALSRRYGLEPDEASLRGAAADASPAALPEAKSPFNAPHFTGRVAAMYRAGPAAPAGSALSAGGAAIAAPEGFLRGALRTTLDSEMQSYAEKRLAAELALLENNRVSSGAVFAIDNSSGAVLVYVGSASWFDEENGGKIDGVRVVNQPGSCLKPFLYSLALEKGFAPNDVLPDIPTVFGGSEAYSPVNFNRRFNGPVRFRVALASSLNIPAVYLLERLGVRSFEEYLVSLGFDSIARTRGSNGTGLALGNAEVSLEELVRAFSVFPRGGRAAVLRWLAEDPAYTADKGGAAAHAARQKAAGDEGRRIMSLYSAAVIADILSDRASRFVGFGPAPALATSFPAMFKTGTANQFQHIWALGATKRFTAGVWMGNFSGETVVGRTGSSIPARLAADLLGALEQTAGAGQPAEELSGDARDIEICALSGMAAGPFCGGIVRERLPPDRLPGVCSWHRSADGEPVYPPEYQAWLRERFRRGMIPPAGENFGGVHIRIPVPGSVFYLDPALPPEAQALRIEAAGFGVEAIVYVDDVPQGGLNPAGVYVLPLRRGHHRIVVEDENGQSAETEIEVR